MNYLTLDGVEALVRENRAIQGCIAARIQVLDERIAAVEDLLPRLAAASPCGPRKETPAPALPDSGGPGRPCGFPCGSAPRGLPPPANFRWSPRAARALRRQADRFGLRPAERRAGDGRRWQAVADAVNFASRAAAPATAEQCRRHFRHALAAPARPFAAGEDAVIERRAREGGAIGWRGVAAELRREGGGERTAFQAAQRYRVVHRGDFEAHGGPEKTWQVMSARNVQVAELSVDTETVVDTVHRVNKGTPPPWIGEDEIRRSIQWERGRRMTYEETLQRDICVVLLSFDSFLSPEARYVVWQAIQYDPVEFADLSRKYKTCYSQISVEEAAQQLSASVTDVSARIVKKAQHYHCSIFSADFFRVSHTLFGHKNAARACFLVAREYERESSRSEKFNKHFGVKRIMASMKDVKNEK